MPSFMIGVCRRIGLPMSLFSVKLSLNSFSPIFGVPSASTNGRPMPPKLNRRRRRRRRIRRRRRRR